MGIEEQIRVVEYLLSIARSGDNKVGILKGNMVLLEEYPEAIVLEPEALKNIIEDLEMNLKILKE